MWSHHKYTTYINFMKICRKVMVHFKISMLLDSMRIQIKKKISMGKFNKRKNTTDMYFKGRKACKTIYNCTNFFLKMTTSTHPTTLNTEIFYLSFWDFNDFLKTFFIIYKTHALVPRKYSLTGEGLIRALSVRKIQMQFLGGMCRANTR